MKLADLKRKGAIIDGGLVSKEIEWTYTDPDSGERVTEVFNIYVQRLSFGAMERLYAVNADRSRTAAYVSACVYLGEDGSDPITYDVAFGMDPALGNAMLKAASEVNGTGSSTPKN